MTLDTDFRMIADWIEAHDGKDGPAFNPPAFEHQIHEAERRLGGHVAACHLAALPFGRWAATLPDRLLGFVPARLAPGHGEQCRILGARSEGFRVDERRYRIDPDQHVPDDERWEFEPGKIVAIVTRNLDHTVRKIAVSADPDWPL